MIIVSGLQTDIDSSIFRVANPYKTAMSHIFIPASRAYFAEEEDKTMLAEFWEFDRKMIHEKYTALVKEFEGK